MSPHAPSQVGHGFASPEGRGDPRGEDHGGTLRRIRRFLRWITAPIQPWDWDELPVRHWWDVYAK